ncbi:MAG: Fibronectin type III domain protein [Candidatus Nomurabacteria bacterium GW2011_GWE1_32_28]|uniref:Fibronectin type III domain protein n=1 Tax=Candidatus Nomurabacteria bacterium GW2011_GWF1_31_48 TaxID=1618767 RepID=A0A0G0BFY5_9BACT|nr:MAG: Fibronectin type III domain protein [Candidatus Nomurabacteria bacterium GW2011_GWF2_30_133]KKP28397.1 MAG: Fibronectin type III domain protein [Candidatus Nomurabacteria bacterium GW2011_GWE2_31_40]KKP29982.1 MAG: Fibronectin type III domain protein [Candidatus Nomurabacteria bacterium GW2011_GWF1_31_48]KKP35091.1 MAG: Fibronectin type III domain protein [Candidatus Nomurabacteria bacterium GW2011_GWE1_32_28]HAS80903.1 hypothetical protein [Candidatus Nomurabacteria bacterium]
MSGVPKRQNKILRLFVSFGILFSINIYIPVINAQTNSIQVDLGVSGCNNNGICESDESLLSCPSDCTPPPPPPNDGVPGIIYPDISIIDLKIEPDFTKATISWKSSIGTRSTIKWGETAELKEGTLSSIVFDINHKAELINLKSGTLYYFSIESQSANGKINIYPTNYFFTKFLKDTSLPLSPRNVKTSADISGINITWENPPDENFLYVRIMRHEDRLRGDPTLGKLIYEGTKEKFLDKNVIAGKKYYYVLFARDNQKRFSGGVGVSQIAYSDKEIDEETKKEELEETTTETLETEIKTTENFFVHQYNQIVELLTDIKSITIDKNKNTVIDTNVKTFSDDLIIVTNEKGEVIGQYLFSFNSDSGRYEGVIPPLEKSETYTIKIYRYKENILTKINEGSLFVEEKTTQENQNPPQKITGILYKNYIYILILLLTLLLLLVYLKKKHKNQ